MVGTSTEFGGLTHYAATVLTQVAGAELVLVLSVSASVMMSAGVIAVLSRAGRGCCLIE